MDTETQARFQRAFDVVRDCGGYVDADIAKIEDARLRGVSVEVDTDLDGSEILTYKHFYEEPNVQGSCGVFARIIARANNTDQTYLLNAYRHTQREGDAFDYRPASLNIGADKERQHVLGYVERALGRMMLLEDE